MAHPVTPPEMLALVLERGPALRVAAAASGIASIEISGDRVSIRFAPPFGIAEPAAPPATQDAGAPAAAASSDIEEIDALDDPATYEDGNVPGYERDEEPTA